MYAKALGRGEEIQTNQCRPSPGETGASTTANYCSAETNTVEVNWKRRQSLLLAGKAVVLHVREAERGERGVWIDSHKQVCWVWQCRQATL